MTLSEDLRSAGLSATRQRVALLSVLRSTRRPLSVDALAKAVKGKMNTTTIYRGLEDLIRAGLVHRVELGRNHALFEATGEHHHHVVCTSCGRVDDVAVCLPAPLLRSVSSQALAFANIDTHALEFFGTCNVCA